MFQSVISNCSHSQVARSCRHSGRQQPSVRGPVLLQPHPLRRHRPREHRHRGQVVCGRGERVRRNVQLEGEDRQHLDRGALDYGTDGK